MWFGESLLKDMRVKWMWTEKSESSRLQYILMCSELHDSDEGSKITKCINATHRGTETDFINIFSLLNKQRETISSDYIQLI